MSIVDIVFLSIFGFFLLIHLICDILDFIHFFKKADSRFRKDHKEVF